MVVIFHFTEKKKIFDRISHIQTTEGHFLRVIQTELLHKDAFSSIKCTWNQLTFHFKVFQSHLHCPEGRLRYFQEKSSFQVVRLWLMDSFYFDLDFVQIFNDNWWAHKNALLLSIQTRYFSSFFFLWVGHQLLKLFTHATMKVEALKYPKFSHIYYLCWMRYIHPERAFSLKFVFFAHRIIAIFEYFSFIFVDAFRL